MPLAENVMTKAPNIMAFMKSSLLPVHQWYQLMECLRQKLGIPEIVAVGMLIAVRPIFIEKDYKNHKK